MLTFPIAMYWVASSEKDTNPGLLEKKLGDAADQFRANSAFGARVSEQEIGQNFAEHPGAFRPKDE